MYAFSQFSSVQSLSRVRLFATPCITHARPPCPSPTPGVHSDSRPSSRWCHPAISSSVVPFSSCPQSLPALESFPMSQLFAWGGQTTGVSDLASFLQLCPTFCGPMDCSSPGSSVHRISQARILEWVAISFSRDLPNPGTVSPALAGRLFTTEPSTLAHVLFSLPAHICFICQSLWGH